MRMYFVIIGVKVVVVFRVFYFFKRIMGIKIMRG